MSGYSLKRILTIQGFTLFEVLLALSLSGLMVAILAGSYLESVHIQQSISGRVTALLLGRSKLAEVVRGSEMGSSGDFPSPYRNYQWVAAEETADTGIKTIRMTVKWRNGNAPMQEIRIKSYQDPE